MSDLGETEYVRFLLRRPLSQHCSVFTTSLSDYISVTFLHIPKILCTDASTTPSQIPSKYSFSMLALGFLSARPGVSREHHEDHKSDVTVVTGEFAAFRGEVEI